MSDGLDIPAFLRRNPPKSEVLDQTTGELVALDDLLTDRLCMSLPDGFSFDEWQTLGVGLAKMEKGVQWWIGDWWAFGQQAYGERAKAAAEGAFGRAFQTLADAGWVARKFETSRRREILSWSHHREVAALPEDDAERLLDEAEREDWSRKELRAAVSRMKTGSHLPTIMGGGGRIEDLKELAGTGRKFGTIYLDPPWLYDNQGTRAATGNHYGGMTVAELCGLPVGELAAKDAHLHLWTTNGFLFECPKLFDAWGFEFRSSFAWVKPTIGIGNYWRNSHELLLTAIRGDAKRFRDHSIRSWIECDRDKHSQKPELVRHFIERASPGPYLELFARGEAPGWLVWGNQVESRLFDNREVA
jgi:N6-adenosine-specific RNA methylase IME4